VTTRVRTHVALGVLILLVFAAISWFLVLSPRIANATDIAAQAEQVDSATTAMQGRYRQTVEQAASATQAAADAQALFESMPQQAELPDVLLRIIDAASRAGIGANQISVINASVPRSLTGDETTGADPESAAGAAAKGLGVELAQLDIDVTVNGDRASLLAFLDNLQGLDRAVLVTATGLTDLSQPANGGPENAPTASGAGQILDVTGSMFVLQSKLPDLVAAVQKVIDDAGVTEVTFVS
jgi:type IV pilus assembly protein PilO